LRTRRLGALAPLAITTRPRCHIGFPLTLAFLSQFSKCHDDGRNKKCVIEWGRFHEGFAIHSFGKNIWAVSAFPHSDSIISPLRHEKFPFLRHKCRTCLLCSVISSCAVHDGRGAINSHHYRIPVTRGFEILRGWIRDPQAVDSRSSGPYHRFFF